MNRFNEINSVLITGTFYWTFLLLANYILQSIYNYVVDLNLFWVNKRHFVKCFLCFRMPETHIIYKRAFFYISQNAYPASLNRKWMINFCAFYNVIFTNKNFEIKYFVQLIFFFLKSSFRNNSSNSSRYCAKTQAILFSHLSLGQLIWRKIICLKSRRN